MWDNSNIVIASNDYCAYAIILTYIIIDDHAADDDLYLVV